MIHAQGLGYSYPGAEHPALRSVSFRLADGEAVALVGRGGAGKSTLLRVLAGLAHGGERQGQLSVEGRDPRTSSVHERLSRVGLLFSDPAGQLSGVCGTVREEVAWGLGNLAVPREQMHARTRAVLDRMGLAPLAERSPFALSGGQQQRVALASVMALSPRVVLLDEPVAMLDPEGRRDVAQAVRDLGSAVIWATPHLEEAAAFPRWLVLRDGALIHDGPAAIPPDHGCLEAPWTRLARRVPGWDRGLPVTEAQTLEGLGS